MKLALLNFSGHFEETGKDISEHLQLVQPESDLEMHLLAWAILPHGEIVADDPNHPNHTFHYELGEHFERGLYQLNLTSRTPQGEWSAELSAAIQATGAPTAGEYAGFQPLWILSQHLRFKTNDARVRAAYAGDAYGHLGFGSDAALPHRRLFRAVAA